MLYEILLTNHKNLINDIIETYFTNNIRDQIMTYFRIYFMFYILVNYVYTQKPAPNKQEIKKLFFDFLNNTIKISQNTNIIKKNLNIHYDKLYKIFFIDNNIYFHVYFNNLIKYFLPVPFDIIEYSPFLTYRSNINNIFYKKSNIDYLEKITDLDHVAQKSYVKAKNINVAKNEIDLHIPIEYFKPLNLNNPKFDIIYLIATAEKLYIAKINNNNNNNLELQILYTRENTNINAEMFKDGVSFELLMPLWEPSDKNKNINKSDIFYISVMKKITKQDLFNCFGKLNFNKTDYKYLYHNTGLAKDKPNKKKEYDINNLLDIATFYYFTPLASNATYKMTDRKCLLFEIKQDINNILDLTTSILTNNSFTEFIANRDKINKKWTSYDNLDTLNYYKSGQIKKKFSENYKCITDLNNNNNIHGFLKERPYCDIAETQYYSGRRKLQEILFKTRKYDISKIWYYRFMRDVYKKYDVNIPHAIYHEKDSDIKYTRDFEKYILKKLDVNGFFFTDFVDSYQTGGEILLIHPAKFIELKKTSQVACSDKHAF